MLEKRVLVCCWGDLDRAACEPAINLLGMDADYVTDGEDIANSSGTENSSIPTFGQNKNYQAVILPASLMRTTDLFPRQLLSHERVIAVDANPSWQSATECLRLGADDYLPLPLDAQMLGDSIQSLSVKNTNTGNRPSTSTPGNDSHAKKASQPHALDNFIGGCPAMQRLFETIERLATSSVDVLISGLTGTGKELVAHALHDRSDRKSSRFVAVDCGAIPESLLESELFGHEQGAFTGANQARVGLMEYAHRGTFFMDEVAELPMPLQSKLLRALQERKIRRVGSSNEIQIDIRLVAATSRDLKSMIQRGEFREDLYYRINVVRIELPPLADRGDDIGLLAEHFALRGSREMGKPPVTISPEAYGVLKSYPWPGNVRELQNIIRRAIALARTSFITVDDLPNEVILAADGHGADSISYCDLRDRHMQRFEKAYLIDMLRKHRGDVRAAAESAQMPRGSFYRLIKKHSLSPEHYR